MFHVASVNLHLLCHTHFNSIRSDNSMQQRMDRSFSVATSVVAYTCCASPSL